ncbi:unnamed protein product [Meloidogyne enterolobii]|uniref:Uncharacterized protein n=1 Tax=Meloidogyne enterolobii TaxID=390850 RepID=A0ACB1AX42_MELEN
MLAFFKDSSIISFRILSILLLFTLATCQSNSQNFPTSIANQVDSKLDEVEPLSIPQRNSQDDFQGSGVNPDDEDGDVDEGSGDGIEGSGSPPIDDNAQIDTQTNINNIEEIRKGNIELTGVPVSTKTNVTATEDESLPRTSKPATKTEQPLFSDTRVNITKESTPASTTIVKTKEIKTSTTIKEKSEKERFPTEFVPPIPTTTKRPTTTSTIKTTPKATISSTKSTKLPKQKMPPPPFIVDPTGTLEQLKPGVFALIVGGAVVFVLLIILVITYIFYRIRKKDEGSYICEDHVQTHRFSNYYQKASTKEFYA